MGTAVKEGPLTSLETAGFCQESRLGQQSLGGQWLSGSLAGWLNCSWKWNGSENPQFHHEKKSWLESQVSIMTQSSNLNQFPDFLPLKWRGIYHHSKALPPEYGWEAHSGRKVSKRKKEEGTRKGSGVGKRKIKSTFPLIYGICMYCVYMIWEQKAEEETGRGGLGWGRGKGWEDKEEQSVMYICSKCHGETSIVYAN